MKAFFLFLIALTHLYAQYTCSMQTPVSVSSNDPQYSMKPHVDGASHVFLGGSIEKWNSERSDVVTSPIIDDNTGERSIIGKMARMNEEDALKAVAVAEKAWNSGQGEWPRMSSQQRIDAIERVVLGLKGKRDEIARSLMWEICKTWSDSLSEVDRTIKFMEQSIAEYKAMDSGVWNFVQSVFYKVKRAAIGIMLCVGPYNYPLNETYATLIPGLLLGNVAIMKIPAVGGLAHVLTMDIYERELPPGVLQFVSGSGRITIPPIMRSGKIDVLAFIGGSKTADSIIKEHPHPHRLKIFLQLEGKNLGIITPSVDVATAVSEVTLGATSFNGQRCTAIKLVMAHDSIADDFAEQLAASISALPFGLPWTDGVKVTPLPETHKIQYLESLIADAVSKGARVINADEGGGDVHGALMRPAVVYPVTPDMRLWHEEQFGPVVPVATYREVSDIESFLHTSPFAQQAAVFAKDMNHAAPLVDVLANVMGRINVNAQCARSPDVVPFSGRRSSALGTMSLSEALRAFSVETVVAGKEKHFIASMRDGLDRTAVFLRTAMLD